jgi:arylsulfatase A-like enzyme
LERQGVADDTFVLFMSDNGRPFPRCKTTVYDSGVKTPFIIRWPKGGVKAGGTCGRVVSAVDLAPTVLDLAGLTPGPTFQGKSFAPLLREPNATVRGYAFSEHNWHDFEARSRAVRSERFRYVRNEYTDLPNTPPADAVRSITFQAMRKLRDDGKLTPAQMTVFAKPLPAEELYDSTVDPHEAHNLAGDPRHAETLATLRRALDDWKRETDDAAPTARTPDEFDRETGEPLPGRQRPRLPPKR